MPARKLSESDVMRMLRHYHFWVYKLDDAQRVRAGQPGEPPRGVFTKRRPFDIYAIRRVNGHARTVAIEVKSGQGGFQFIGAIPPTQDLPVVLAGYMRLPDPWGDDSGEYWPPEYSETHVGIAPHQRAGLTRYYMQTGDLAAIALQLGDAEVNAKRSGVLPRRMWLVPWRAPDLEMDWIRMELALLTLGQKSIPYSIAVAKSIQVRELRLTACEGLEQFALAWEKGDDRGWRIPASHPLASYFNISDGRLF